ncbi:MAG: tRNA pseudouridine(13) synthase TruD [Deltaproteobacteria bacterium]|nr:tRNA pseudouridine(13) synthase TruD [Deltaproteobacteria bacterium]
MRLKTRPEDFIVREAYHFEKAARGAHYVYLMDKQKLSTLEAIHRVAEANDLPPHAISFCGLKDKQGRTEQIIAVDGKAVEHQEPNLRLKFLGRTKEPLSAANLRANRFVVTVRDLTLDEAERIPASVVEVRRSGVINYFDSQRFGSVKHGQGYVVRDLLQGRSEDALRQLIARPSRLDKSEDARVKAFWARHWGEWKRRCSLPAARTYEPIIRSLRENPRDFLKAFGAMETRRRTLLLFEFQSLLWNETARIFLEEAYARERLLALRYQAGIQRFPRPDPEERAEVDTGPSLAQLRKIQLPLLGPDTELTDPRIAAAVNKVLKKQRLKLSDLKLPAAARMVFKDEPRALVVKPTRLSVVNPRPDELNPGRVKISLAFTLPSGAYATLVVRRVMWFADSEVRDWGGPLPEAHGDFLSEELRREVHSRFSRAQGRRRNRRPRAFKGIAVEETREERATRAPTPRRGPAKGRGPAPRSAEGSRKPAAPRGGGRGGR